MIEGIKWVPTTKAVYFGIVAGLSGKLSIIGPVKIERKHPVEQSFVVVQMGFLEAGFPLIKTVKRGDDQKFYISYAAREYWDGMEKRDFKDGYLDCMDWVLTSSGLKKSQHEAFSKRREVVSDDKSPEHTTRGELIEHIRRLGAETNRLQLENQELAAANDFLRADQPNDDALTDLDVPPAAVPDPEDEENPE